jgi:hypothetical protein
MTATPKPAPAAPAVEVDPITSPLWDAGDPPAIFEWTSPRTGATVHLISPGDMPFGVFEDALEQGEGGVALLVRKACVRASDHTALRVLRMREVNDLFRAWNGGASVGESSSSST